MNAPGLRFPESLKSYCREHHVRRLSLFGSHAKGTANAESDIDVLRCGSIVGHAGDRQVQRCSPRSAASRSLAKPRHACPPRLATVRRMFPGTPSSACAIAWCLPISMSMPTLSGKPSAWNCRTQGAISGAGVKGVA
ncbi:MAG: nucleotidyltransferase domain-containing protein [Sterolibacteriaceae bacterium]|nr:nucleotidyltransferase domain-containing protein [Sterolibacteriaceae bacterium]